MAFALPVVRGNFLYNGDLHVDVGSLNRHKRASVAHLTELLRPDLKGPKNGGQPKDPPGHWYEAQLIHYGLPPSKDKARAKMRLLENLNKSSLNVPTSITTTEAEMKKDFAAAERKAKAQLKAASAERQVPSKTTQNAKRKQSDNTSHYPSMNLNINIGVNTSPGQEPAPTKKRRIQTARRGGLQSSPSTRILQQYSLQEASSEQSIPTETVAGTPKPRPKQTARRGGYNTSFKSADQSHEPSTPTTPAITNARVRPKQTARRGHSSSSLMPTANPHPGVGTTAPNSARPGGSFGLDTGDLQRPTPKKETKFKTEQKPKVKAETGRKEPTIKKESKLKQEQGIKREVPIKSEQIPSQLSLGLINGIYDITCYQLQDDFGCYDMTLILTLDTPGIWGAYDFGPFSGILYIYDRPLGASNQSLDFEWRGRNGGEGEMVFGDHCHGCISFLGNGRIEGSINLYGECQFEGMRRAGPATAIKSAGSMRQEWEGYSEEQYERERVGRWGGGW